MGDLKKDALLATAMAFYKRKKYIQYDELSMDRVFLLTPRRMITLPPEMANEKFTLYLDCSSFVYNCYYQTFGTSIGASLSPHMYEHAPDSVYYYEISGEETEEERQKVAEEMKAALQVGDIITFTNRKENGHVMLYIGDGQFMNVSCHGKFHGYDYQKGKDTEDPEGSVFIEPVDCLFEKREDISGRLYLWEKRSKVGINRPLNHMPLPLPNAVYRLTEAKDLFLSVETDYTGAKTAEKGSIIEYRLTIRNESNEAKKILADFTAGKGSIQFGEHGKFIEMKAGETTEISFFANVGTDAPYVEAPIINVQGFQVATPIVLVGRNLKKDERILLPKKPKEIMQDLFTFHDGLGADVLSRKVQVPGKDGNVYGFFGGQAVVTPEAGSHYRFRTTKITSEDLETGDYLIFSDDLFFEKLTVYEKKTEGLAKISLKENGEADEESVTLLPTEEEKSVIHSAFSKTVWALIRPSMIQS